MRFSTTLASSNNHTSPSISSIRKVFSTLVSKLPNHQKVGPSSNNNQNAVKIGSSSVIKRVAKSTTAIKTDNEMNQDLRNYYSSKKRQLEDVDNKRLIESERETRHKTVKQYQQTQGHHHWIEHSNPTMNNNKSAQQPKWANTHGYVRDTRSNSDYLRKLAITNNSSMVINNKSSKKRTDEFTWGKESPLRNVV